MKLLPRLIWHLDRFERDGGMRDVEVTIMWLALLFAVYAALWRMA